MIIYHTKNEYRLYMSGHIGWLRSLISISFSWLVLEPIVQDYSAQDIEANFWAGKIHSGASCTLLLEKDHLACFSCQNSRTLL